MTTDDAIEHALKVAITWCPNDRAEVFRISLTAFGYEINRFGDVDGLRSDLDSALDVLWRRGDDGAREWVRMNYPTFAASQEGRE